MAPTYGSLRGRTSKFGSTAIRAASVSIIVLASMFTSAWISSVPASAAGISASIDQCTNGTVGPPILAAPCVGSVGGSVSVAIPGINGGAVTSYSNWVHGNANGSKAHWREGEYIAYRAALSDVAANVTHTLVLHYDVVSSSHHAIDYLGSYDATESASTSTVSSQGRVLHANNSSPCADLAGSGAFPWSCTPATPQYTFLVPQATMTGPGGQQGCDGASGTWTGHQGSGTFDLLGPSGSRITGVNYLSENVPNGGGSCITTVAVSFTVPQTVSVSQSVVLAWGGHIASTFDWGAGGSATSISGSPFHMHLDSIDGASTGSQNRALDSSAIYFTPSISTQVMVNSAPLTGTVALGSTVNDTSTFVGASPSAGGTVTYSRYPSLDCTGSPDIQTVSVTNSSISPSASFVPIAGGYSYQATYNGDNIDLPTSSACEPFSVGQGSASLSTTVFNAATGSAVTNPVPLGVTVYDTATVSSSTGVTPTGTLTYSFYRSGDCTSGTQVGTQTVTLSGGLVPNSATRGPLDAANAPYAFEATYSGDSNFLPGSSGCEPFTVGKGTVSLSTIVNNAATSELAVSPVALGSSVYDTAQLTWPSSVAPTGTVTYTFYRSGSCTTGSIVGANTVTLVNGLAPNSTVRGPLDAANGPYAYRADYSGDANFVAGASGCEPFAVVQGSTQIATVVYDTFDNNAAENPVALGTTVYDTATITSTTNVVPTGTVTYTFFSNGDCATGSVVGTSAVTLASGLVPNSSTRGPLTAASGPYAFRATYSGDANFVSGASGCEAFSVAAGAATLTTVVFNAATNAALANPVPLAVNVYDTAILSTGAEVVPTGTLTYSFFQGGTCTTGALVGSPNVVTLINGTAPHSTTQGPLSVAGGPYAFRASYSGDVNFVSGTSGCEPFAVGQSTTTLSTTVFSSSNSSPLTGPVALGSSVYDTSQLTTGSTFTPTGTVTYTFFKLGDCTSTVVFSNTVTLSGGAVPNSSATAPLDAANRPYAFAASYSGDANFVGGTSSCEPFTVSQASAALSTVVFDTFDNNPAENPVPLGTTVYDTATLQTNSGVVPTGTVTYTFFHFGDCESGTPLSSSTVTLASGIVPNSTTQGPLSVASGPYAYEATYSGDANYVAGSSACEPFAVGQGAAAIATTIFDSVSDSAIHSPVPLGTTVFDTATMATSSEVAFTGTVTYTFYRSGDCQSGTAVGANTVTIANGQIPNSSARGPLDAANGPYAYQASYSGDVNFLPGTSGCEPFAVAKGSVSLPTVVFDAVANEAIRGPVQLGETVYDTSVLVSSSNVVPTGTVSYTFFTSGDCTSGTASNAADVQAISGGVVPHSATSAPLDVRNGPYAYQVTYSGDANFVGGTSGCEPFAVGRLVTSLFTVINDANSNTPIGAEIRAGSSFYDTATLNQPTRFIPTGTVTYTFFASGDCETGTAVGRVTEASISDGVVGNSDTEHKLSAKSGPYAFRAVYSGDVNFLGAVSSCETFAVVAVQPSITTTLSLTSVLVNEKVSDSATLLGATSDASGSVTYTSYADNSCTTVAHSIGAVAVESGQAPSSPEISFPIAGTYYFQAAYSGDANNSSTVSDCTSEVLVVSSPPIGPPQTGLAIQGGAGGVTWLAGVLVVGLGTILIGRQLRRRTG